MLFSKPGRAQPLDQSLAIVYYPKRYGAEIVPDENYHRIVEAKGEQLMQVPAAKIYFSEKDRKKILKQVDEILEGGQLTLGKYTRDFEEEFTEYVGVKYAVAVNSGTSALEISLRALDIQGFSVIVPTNTFFATPASVIHAGGKVILPLCNPRKHAKACHVQ